MTRSTDSRRARNSASLTIGARRRPASRPSRRRCFLASSRVEPLTAVISSSALRLLRTRVTVFAGSSSESPPSSPVRRRRRRRRDEVDSPSAGSPPGVARRRGLGVAVDLIGLGIGVLAARRTCGGGGRRGDACAARAPLPCRRPPARHPRRCRRRGARPGRRWRPSSPYVVRGRRPRLRRLEDGGDRRLGRLVARTVCGCVLGRGGPGLLRGLLAGCLLRRLLGLGVAVGRAIRVAGAASSWRKPPSRPWSSSGRLLLRLLGRGAALGVVARGVLGRARRPSWWCASGSPSWRPVPRRSPAASLVSGVVEPSA